jgi:hypothetical protein
MVHGSECECAFSNSVLERFVQAVSVSTLMKTKNYVLIFSRIVEKYYTYKKILFPNGMDNRKIIAYGKR